MGRQAYPIIGGIIGAAVTWYAGGSGYGAGFAIGAAIGGVVGSYADPLIIQGNKIGDTSLQTASEGGARGIMFGRCCVTATCVIARGNRQITKKQSGGGKGSSDDGSTVNETVSWTFAIGLGEAYIGASICRIWQDETLVYDTLGDGAMSDADTEAFEAKFTFYDGSEDQLPDPDLQVFLGLGNTPYFRGTAYAVFPNFDLTNTAERIPTFRFELRSGSDGDGLIRVSRIAETLLQRFDLLEEEYDVGALEDRVAGLCIQDSMSGAEALTACIQPFFADPCEIDGVLTWVKRGNGAARILTVDDLTEEPDVRSRENAIEYPAKLHFFYQSPTAGYATTKATSYRYSPQADSSGEGSVVCPVTFYDGDEPAQIASKIHKTMWAEAEGSFEWQVGDHCLDLVPTDALELQIRGTVSRARIIGTEYDGRTIKLSMIKDRPSAYRSDITGNPIQVPTPPLPVTMSKAVLAVMDLPALIDTDDALVYYTAMSGTTNVWRGGEVQGSLDGGATWKAVGQFKRDSVMGKLVVPMTAAIREFTDTTNVVMVQLFDKNNEIIAYDEYSFRQEQGAIAIQHFDKTWEVLQYRDAVDMGAGLWKLSYLQRGRLNTRSGPHPEESLFVLLDVFIAKNNAQSAWLFTDLLHRGVSYSSNPDTADVVTTAYKGLSQKEWSPASFEAEYDGTYVYVHDIVPRHRFGTEVVPIPSVNFQGFDVVCSNGLSTVIAPVVAGIALINTAILGSVVTVSVAAVNRITGDGEPLVIVPTAVPPGSLTPP